MRLMSGDARHIMLFGGSRSGKTFLIVWAIVTRALAAKMSRHAILRFRFNHCKAAIVSDTFPKVMRLCFPDHKYEINKDQWYAQFSNGSQIWFGGLDDKERTEKILGNEYVTMFLNECSQIPLSSREMARTRLAQECALNDGTPMRLKMYYDCNPPSQAHWSYKYFIKHQDATSRRDLPNPDDYACLMMNPVDNLENLPAGYIDELESLPDRLRRRFLEGKFASVTDNALWTEETLDRWRVLDGSKLPEFQRVIVAVDPSGADDDENINNDEIGICVAALGADGNGYILEDLTLKAGPAKWGNVATTAYDRHGADKVVGEDNYGGAMVKHVIQTARPGTPYESVKATRGKVVRAEPISALFEQGKARMVGRFDDLEDELLGFTTAGYIGEKSPNRADALVWAMTALFPAVTKRERKWEPIEYDNRGIL